MKLPSSISFGVLRLSKPVGEDSWNVHALYLVEVLRFTDGVFSLVNEGIFFA